MPPTDEHAIDSLAKLRSVIAEPAEGVQLKIYDALPEEAISFIERSPFAVLATSDAAGNLDASPKGDEPGFVTVLDDTTLLVPDRPGNKLAYGLTNILTNPHVGLLFLIPGTTETLRVNGRAELRTDPDLLEGLAARGRPALLAIRVSVEQCFFHCSKAFLRSQLWKPDTWPERQKVSFGQMVAKRLELDDPGLAEAIDTSIEENYRTEL